MLDANATANLATPDEIRFNIPGAGPHTIQPLSALPDITDLVVIDGYTQPGSSPNTNATSSGLGLNTVLTIEIDGSLTGADVHGLVIRADQTTIKGIIINSFSGVHNDRDYNVIGGDVVGARNIISGNNSAGIYCSAGFSTIKNNFIGTDISGTIPIGNGNGIWMFRDHNQIGGSGLNEGNFISGNFSNGIQVQGINATHNKFQGNKIGTDYTGLYPIPNSHSGIAIVSDTSNNHIILMKEIQLLITVQKRLGSIMKI